jgi:EAL domain-containing protein (putative c-di-GMP-specific phosphodiesterase class I)
VQAAQGISRPRPGPKHQGLVTQLGYRSETTVDAATAGVGLIPMFQPVVSLPDEQVVGFEALARWPKSAAITPETVFSFATDARTTDVLDQHCIEAAARTALRTEMPPGSLLLINTEPAAAHIPRANHPALSDACDRFQVVFEITERRLLAHPHTLLKKVEAIRADGIAIALDDVGAHPDSLAVLDVLAPDFVKLDMSMIQNIPERDKAATLMGVLAYQERTGALITAEGVETDEHLEQALAVGATLAQGYRFGRAAPLNRRQCECRPRLMVRPQQSRTGSAHSSKTEDRKALHVARKDVVTAFSRHIEEQARQSVDHPIVLAALQRADNLAAGSRQIYQELATTSPLVAVFGRDVPADLGGGVRGVELQPDDPLCEEWVVVTIGAHTASALVARQIDDPASHVGNRRFEFLITSDRALVTAAARSLLARVP